MHVHSLGNAAISRCASQHKSDIGAGADKTHAVLQQGKTRVVMHEHEAVFPNQVFFSQTKYQQKFNGRIPQHILYNRWQDKQKGMGAQASCRLGGSTNGSGTGLVEN